jgi:heptosyltransferase-2
MPHGNKFIVIQTAFPGDVVLTLPLVQVLKRHLPDAIIDVLVIPKSAELLYHHPGVHDVIVYDKKGKDAGITSVAKVAGILREKKYGTAIIPHRSLRSAALAAFARIPKRIGFDTSAGKFLMTDVVRYNKESHEISRNMSLLIPLGIREHARELPGLYPSAEDISLVKGLLSINGEKDTLNWIAIAPGTVWNTKRWQSERFAAVARHLLQSNFSVMLIGGKEDENLCRAIEQTCGSEKLVNLAGKCTLLQSAAAIQMCKLLICNDSAPMHLAVAMKTPVVALFGATAPSFGFAPLGERDVVIETSGLACRPCTIHGGDTCPITTFDCMNNISVDHVTEKALEIARTSA